MVSLNSSISQDYRRSYSMFSSAPKMRLRPEKEKKQGAAVLEHVVLPKSPPSQISHGCASCMISHKSSQCLVVADNACRVGKPPSVVFASENLYRHKGVLSD